MKQLQKSKKLNNKQKIEILQNRINMLWKEKQGAIEGKSQMIKLLPAALLGKCTTQKSNQLGLIHESICLMHSYAYPEQFINFFKQLNINFHIWSSLPSSEEKTRHIFNALDKNVEQKIHKIMQQSNNTEQFNGRTCLKTKKTEKSKGNEFQWLNLPTKNQMLKPKLKTKLVQSINQYKNQSKLRKAQNRILEQAQKIALEDDSFDLKVDDEIKMKYTWNQDDEQIFQDNVKKLKQKFNKTQFLKNCHRYKFITNHQLCTLASQEVSRKLDKSTKAFLSREFLLDKYFSSKENLTQKQMKFILKTSPLLSKCVDKSFIKTSVRNIRYEDIQRMELQIAEDIIKKFESIRNVVKSSRKEFKKEKNERAKKSIKKFEEKKKFQIQRLQGIEDLQKHKTKIMRKINYKPLNNQNQQNSFSETHKASWPFPLNNMHPSTGLFIKDCVNEQINQDLNQYENNYMQQLNSNAKSSSALKSEMIKFYSGGPVEANYQTYCQIDEELLKIICETLKRFSYDRQMSSKLDSLNIDQIEVAKKSALKTAKSIVETTMDLTRRTKKSDEPQQIEQVIRQKIMEGKQKSKNALIAKKLLILAAQNSFTTLKALNPRLPPFLINSTDKKGNTALFYAIKHRNLQFTDYLLSKKADVNLHCNKGLTPLHMAFKTNDYSLICKCLTGTIPPNLNVIDEQNRTPLYYCSRKILQMLSLENGVVQVMNKTSKFDNNQLLQNIRPLNSQNDQLECAFDFKKKSIKIIETQF